MNSPIRTLDEALASLAVTREPARDLWPDVARALQQDVSPERGRAPGRDRGRTAGQADVGPADGAPATRSPMRVATRRPLALVAGIAVLGLATSLAWNFRSLPLAPRGAAPASTSPAGTLAISARFAPPTDAHYLAARAELERTFRERLGLLAPATQTRIQADLDAIRAANADIRKALADDPASPLLLQLLGSTWQQEIDLYRNVARATSPMDNRSNRT